MTDRLYRSRSDRVIAGVAGGLAEQLNVDPSLVRIVWVLLAIASGGILVIVYLVMAVIVPEAPFDTMRGGAPGYDPWSSPAATGVSPTPPSADPSAPSTGASTVPSGFVGDVEPGPLRDPDDTQAVPIAARVADPVPSPGPSPAGTPPSTWIGPDGRRTDSASFAARTPVSTPGRAPLPPAAPPRRGDPGGALVLGIILILIGAYFLLREYVPQVDVATVWPALAVAAGVVLIVLSVLPGRGRR